MSVIEPQVRRWTRKDYYTMGDAGLFEGRRTELIDGEIVEMSPQRSYHSAALGLVESALATAFGRSYWIRIQCPLVLGTHMEPEPDVVVVRGSPRDFTGEHPTTADLIVEISETTLVYDQIKKASIYASGSIQEYWILNLVDRNLEVCREPVPDSSQPFKFGYGRREIFTVAQVVAPLNAKHATIAVADLLP